MKTRSILSVFILSFITCGIYSLYWSYVMTEDMNQKEPSEPLTNFIVAILLGCVTCGIYYIYWQYKFFKKLDSVTGEDNCLLNFILSFFFSPIIGSLLAQNSVNKMLEN